MTKTYVVLLMLAVLIMGCGQSKDAVEIHAKQQIEVAGLVDARINLTEYAVPQKHAAISQLSLTSASAPEDSARVEKSTTIIRLDEGAMYSLEDRGQTYVSLPIDQIKQSFERTQEALAAMDTTENPEEGIQHLQNSTWTTDFEAGLGSEEVNGFNCQKARYTITGTSDARPTDSVFLIADIWYSNDFPQAEFLESHTDSIIAALGLDPNWSANLLQTFMSRMPHAFAGLMDKVKELDGVPIKSDIAVDIATPVNPDEAVADSLLVGDMVGTVIMIARQYAQMAGVEPPAGHYTLMSANSEITDIKWADVKPSVFEIPEGYQESQMPQGQMGQR